MRSKVSFFKKVKTKNVSFVEGMGLSLVENYRGREREREREGGE